MSYRLVIIDDNPTTVRSLAECFDWASLDVEVAGCAYDGVTGKELIKEIRPDLVITDINMPETDGLSMIEQLSAESCSAKFIIITGYDEFQYASRAIKLSVFDFILKPIDDEELEKTIRHAIDSLKKERSIDSDLQMMQEYIRRAELLSMLTTTDSLDTNSLSSLYESRIDLESYCIITAQCKNGISQPLLRRIDSDPFPSSMEIISVITDDILVFLCILAEEAGWKQSVQAFAESLFAHDQDFFISVSEIHHSREYIREAYQEAKWLLLDSRLMEQFGNIRFYENLQNKQLSCTGILSAETMAAVKEVYASKLLFQDVFRTLYGASEGNIEALRIILMHYSRLFIRNKAVRKQWPEILDKVIFHVTEVQDKQDARAYLAKFFMVIDDLKKEESDFSPLVNKVLCHISMHAVEGVRLADIAQKFYVSPNHLSTLIKKETGITFQHHLLNAKIRVAKQMLGDTRMRIEEIAHAIGYENYVSFYTVFKRIEGKTPSEYRISLSSEESGRYESYFSTVVQT